jgi:Zn ribbon nucleic-acid-binding protein
MTTVCKHPKVRIVAREEDAEYVECIDCGEVFDSHEYADIVQEESAESTLATEDEDA